ncbi:hypothetical protein MTO96_016976 [Rhipicephalus appendiculatus]
MCYDHFGFFQTSGCCPQWDLVAPCTSRLQAFSPTAMASPVQPNQGSPFLLLGCAREVEPHPVYWSSPVACLDVANQFVHIPGLGDVRVSAQRAGHTTHLLVQVVSRAEVSAKEIRSRIGEVQPATDVEVRGTPDGMSADSILAMSDESHVPVVPAEDFPPLSPPVPLPALCLGQHRRALLCAE